MDDVPAGACSAKKAIGSTFSTPDAVAAQDVVFVQHPVADTLDEQRPDARAGHQMHLITGPPVEIGVEPDGLGAGCPHRETVPWISPRSSSCKVTG